jgi:hypothetical protein
MKPLGIILGKTYRNTESATSNELFCCFQSRISNILMIRTVNTIHTQSLSASAIAAIKDLADSVFLYVFPKIIPNNSHKLR